MPSWRTHATSPYDGATPVATALTAASALSLSAMLLPSYGLGPQALEAQRRRALLQHLQRRWLCRVSRSAVRLGQCTSGTSSCSTPHKAPHPTGTAANVVERKGPAGSVGAAQCTAVLKRSLAADEGYLLVIPAVPATPMRVIFFIS